MIPKPRKGNPQLDLVFAGVGHVRRSVPAKDYGTVADALHTLYQDEQFEALRAYLDGHITNAEIVRASKREKLTNEFLLERVHLDKPLWSTMRSAIEELGESDETRARYRWSLTKLEAHAGLGSRPAVRALARVRWKAVRRQWPGRNGKPPCSASDWMRMRQMVGATLTVILGDPHHEFRRRVMRAIPRAQEKPRVVELSVSEFWSLVRALPPQARPGVVTLAATGFRLGEYLSCRTQHLNALALSIRNPKGKTGADVVYVAEWLWPWIEAAIPAPIKERWLGIHFRRARLAIGHPDLHLHDLRHLFGQLAADEGEAQSSIQAALRHETPGMTARYLQRTAKRGVADAVGRALKHSHRRGA